MFGKKKSVPLTPEQAKGIKDIMSTAATGKPNNAIDDLANLLSGRNEILRNIEDYQAALLKEKGLYDSLVKSDIYSVEDGKEVVEVGKLSRLASKQDRSKV